MNASPLRIALKALVLFAIFNVLYYVMQPLDLLNRLTVYNWLVPGRARLPFSEFPTESYSLTINSLDQMLASHEVARPKAPDEFRVLLLGDSAVWGYLLTPDQTQAACLNRLNLKTPSGKRVRVHNLGHPTLTVMKDLLILRHAMPYQPDLVLWPTSLASLYPMDQLDFPLVKAHYDEVMALVAQYNFRLPQLATGVMQPPGVLDRTFFGQRRQLADWLRYQLYGLGWAGTGIDHIVPKFIAPHPVNLLPNEDIYSPNPMLLTLTQPKRFTPADLSVDILRAGIQTAKAQNVPVLIINEPIYRNENDPLRWNTYYPRWAYDSYRESMQEVASREGWEYLDLWDAAPPDQFTDTDFHLNAGATCAYVEKLAEPLLRLAAH